MSKLFGCVGTVSSDAPAPAGRAMSDEELWQLIGWRPTSPQERARAMYAWSPASSSARDSVPSRIWIDWAKGEILRTDNDQALYLCRLLRILELFHRDEPNLTPRVEEDFLCAALTGGWAVSGQRGLVDDGRQSDVMVGWAQQRRLVHIEDIDEWNPGMASGSGWKRYVRLTVAGRRLVESGDLAPLPPLDNTSGESPSSFQETKTSHPQAVESAPSSSVGHGGAVSTPSTDGPAPIYCPNEKRDAWIYEECVKGTPYKEIRRQLLIKSETEGVEYIESFSGIRKAASRYAHTHDLPLPPKRQHGRPPAEKNGAR